MKSHHTVIICIVVAAFYSPMPRHELSTPSPAEARIIKKTDSRGNVSLYNITDRQVSPGAGQLKKDLSSKYDGLITDIAGREGVDPYLVKCIVRVESNFNPDAVSPAGAMGLMQLMADTARMYNCTEPFDPEMNLDAGVRHFKGLLAYFKQDVPLSLAAYHAGLGRVRKKMSIPPIKSTIDYVNSVMSLYSGSRDYSAAVKKLYRKIQSDGSLLLYSK